MAASGTSWAATSWHRLTTEIVEGVDHGDANRDWARARVEKKHKLRADLVACALINVALVVTWAATGFGYFWPGWVLGFWAVFLLLDAWNLYYRQPVTDEEIDKELRNRGAR